MQCCYTYILWLRCIVVTLSLLVTLPHTQTNRPFPSSPGPLYQDEVICKCPAFVMEIIFTLLQIKLIFTRKDVLLFYEGSWNSEVACSCEDFAWKTRFDGKRATKKSIHRYQYKGSLLSISLIWLLRFTVKSPKKHLARSYVARNFKSSPPKCWVMWLQILSRSKTS